MNPEASPWETLFPAASDNGRVMRLRLRLLRRHGQPLLLVPEGGRAARTALNLYPAQTRKARLARGVLRALASFGVLPGAETCELRLAADAPFVQFVCPPSSGPEAISLAVLLGNPNVAGRRFLLLVFGGTGHPMRVIKLGTDVAAAWLVRREAEFLRNLTPGRLHAPELLGEFSEGDRAALALAYAPGPTPAADDFRSLPALLNGWLDTTRTVRFGELAAARQLAESGADDAASRLAQSRLAEATFHPAIHHGDFAPWNIRVGPAGEWRVLDWERGEAVGPPAWDWFHYWLQPRVLVRRQAPAEILREFATFRCSAALMTYAQTAGIKEHLDALWLGYLVHCRDVTRQAEGMPAIRELVERVAA
jgi:hypothetical protein